VVPGLVRGLRRRAGRGPQGPATGKSRVKKGGAFYADGRGAAERSGYPPEVAMRNVGFRLVPDAECS